MIELLNCDCMDYMKDCEDNAFDLAIVDPPYGIGMDGGNIGKGIFIKKTWDVRPNNEYFIELQRVSVNHICWGGNYFAHSLPETSAWIYWDKMQDGFGKTFSSGELAHTSFNSPMRQFIYKYQGNYIGFPNAITTKTGNPKELKIHPTQKPVKLYEWLLTNYAKPTDRIVDTHLGSGSSAIAVHYFGCDFVGMEIDKDYYEAACQRFNDETKQLDLLA